MQRCILPSTLSRSMANQVMQSLSMFFGNTAENSGYADEDRYVQSSGAPTASPEAGDDSSKRDDLLDQHVAYFLKHHPDVHKKHHIVRVRPGVYNYDGREISVEWKYADMPGEQGHLVAVDGPLRQPFADYVEENENSIEYDDHHLGNSALSQLPKGKRLSFGDSSKVYSRLEAMKIAKEQALVREKAADLAANGQIVPQHELMEKYNKTISIKLGQRRERQAAEDLKLQPPLQAEAPVAVMPSPPPPAQQSGKSQRTHGAPKYCANHDQTAKRKKTAPQNLPCSTCQLVIQTNYVEFKLCPTCSERNHRCMCCGAAAVGAAPSPQAMRQAPSSPMHATASPQHHAHSKSPAQSPVSLFGMPDMLNGPPKANAGGVVPPWPGMSPHPATPQSAFAAAQSPMASRSPVASQSPYAAQNQFAMPYKPVASPNVSVMRPF